MKKSAVIAFLLLFVVTACASDDSPPPSNVLGRDVKDKSWNVYFKLVDDPVLSNSYKNGQDLTLRVESLSDTPIVFLENFGLQLLVDNEQGWSSIESNSYNSGLQYLPPKKDYPLGLLVSALPNISNLTSPTSVRIVVIGHLEDHDEELLGAYIDITIHP